MCLKIKIHRYMYEQITTNDLRFSNYEVGETTLHGKTPVELKCRVCFVNEHHFGPVISDCQINQIIKIPKASTRTSHLVIEFGTRSLYGLTQSDLPRGNRTT